MSLESKTKLNRFPPRKWKGKPYSEIWNDRYKRWLSKKNLINIIDYWLEVEHTIRNADLAECLTSPSEYVREYRRYYESRKTNRTIEQQISEISEMCYPSGVFHIDDFYWGLEPMSEMSTSFPDLDKMWNNIDKLIKAAPLEVCLTSPSEYIRECKSYYERKKHMISNENELIEEALE